MYWSVAFSAAMIDDNTFRNSCSLILPVGHTWKSSFENWIFPDFFTFLNLEYMYFIHRGLKWVCWTSVSNSGGCTPISHLSVESSTSSSEIDRVRWDRWNSSSGSSKCNTNWFKKNYDIVVFFSEMNCSQIMAICVKFMIFKVQKFVPN